MAGANRWLPPNSPMNSGMGSSSGLNVAMLVVAIVAAVAAGASAFFTGRPFIASVLDGPEREQRRDDQIRLLRDENNRSTDKLTDKVRELNRQAVDLQRELQRQEEAARHQREIAEM